jgi:hypothetical protein
MDNAVKIVDKIIEDIEDRDGLNDTWLLSMDDENRAVARQEWIAIVAKVLKVE